MLESERKWERICRNVNIWKNCMAMPPWLQEKCSVQTRFTTKDYNNYTSFVYIFFQKVHQSSIHVCTRIMQCALLKVIPHYTLCSCDRNSMSPARDRLNDICGYKTHQPLHLVYRGVQCIWRYADGRAIKRQNIHINV